MKSGIFFRLDVCWLVLSDDAVHLFYLAWVQVVGEGWPVFIFVRPAVVPPDLLAFMARAVGVPAILITGRV